MKLLSLFLCALVLVPSPLQASPRHPPGNAKITKNEAEHIALKRFPGARVTEAKLETVQGQLVWSLQIVGEGKNPAQQVVVDAITGRILLPPEKKP